MPQVDFPSDGAWAKNRWKRRLRHYLSHLDFAERQQTAAGELFPLSRLLTHSRPKNEALIRSLCRSVYLGDSRAICRVLGRYKMYVDSQDVGLSSHLMIDGYWEMWVTETMARLIKPGMVVADIGANLGYFTLMMGDLVGPAGWVHAFEPNPPIVERLRHSVSINEGYQRTTVHQVALADHDGEAHMFVPTSEPKNASLVTHPDPACTIPVPVRRLDSLEGMDRLDFIKIDVEGAEEALWRGMDRLLGSDRPLTILLEFAAVRYADPERFIDDILRRKFSLSLIQFDGRATTLDKAALLSLPRDQDQMLLLQR